MIVELPELQAYVCDGCERVYEMRRVFGREDEMNLRIDFKRRLEQRHKDCVPKEVVEAMAVQATAR